jgi:hypothetical protein
MKTPLLISIAVILSICSGSLAYAGDPMWIQGSGKSCPQVCNDNNLFPVAAGTYTNGNKFYTCAGNANGEGFRTGYNLSPKWSTSCIVGLGGKEVFEKSYYCLCYDKNISID